MALNRQILRGMLLGVVLFLASCHMSDRDRSLPAAGELAPHLAAPTAGLTPTSFSLQFTGTMTPPIATTLSPTPNLLPPTSTPTPLPPIPTPTPMPLILAAPIGWDNLADWLPPTWLLQLEEDPALLLGNGVVDAALLPNEDGELVGKYPIALTVPFTLDWHEVSMTRAREIIADGHAMVLVQPWAEMSPDRRALRVNGRSPADPDYPLQETWSLLGSEGVALADLVTRLRAYLAPEPVVHLAAVGDLMLDRSLGWHIQQGNLAYPFARMAEHLQAADLVIGNLECALGDVGAPVAKRYPFRAPPEAAAALALAGFDVLNLANNHAGDYGMEALLRGLDLLRAAGIAPIGAGANAAAARAPYIVRVNGLTLAFLGYVDVPIEAIGNFDTASWTATADSPGLAWAVPAHIQEDVAAVIGQVDLVIVSLHSGYEYVAAPSPPQTAAARAAIDAGAHLVLGHHAHILQGIEFHGHRVIAYGLGNFAFEIDGPPETAVFNLWLDKNGVRELEIVPAIIQFGGQPRLAETYEAGPIRQQVYHLTNLLNSSR